MCGIFGFIGKPDEKTPKILINLMVLNEERGKDSAGIVVASDKGIKLFKKAVNATKFVGYSRTVNVLSGIAGNPWATVIGHTRAATQGAITDANAHPFQIGKYYFAHNGIVSNFAELQKEYGTKFEVDSQILGYLVEKVGFKKALEEKVRGWFAMPYFHSDNPSRLYIAKHTAPLSFAYLKGNQGVYFSSQKEHLLAAFKHAKADFKRMKEKTTSKIHVLTWTGTEVVRQSEDLTCLPYSFYNWQYETPAWDSKKGNWVYGEHEPNGQDTRQDWYEHWYNRRFKLDD